MKKALSFFITAVMAVTCFAFPAEAGEAASLDISRKNISHSVSPTLYGAFIEDISKACDGGLVSNLVYNNSFEYNDTAENNQELNEYTVLSACQSYDDGNIDTVKKMMNVSTGVAGVGTAVSLVGTATAVAGAVKSLRGQDDSKLNKVSKIATGATAATGATTGVISGIAKSKAKKDFDSAQRCESVLRNI